MTAKPLGDAVAAIMEVEEGLSVKPFDVGGVHVATKLIVEAQLTAATM